MQRPNDGRDDYSIDRRTAIKASTGAVLTDASTSGIAVADAGDVIVAKDHRIVPDRRRRRQSSGARTGRGSFPGRLPGRTVHAELGSHRGRSGCGGV